MRKAKVAALIFGGVSTCIFGGLFGVYATAPIVSSVAPKNDVQSLYVVESEEMANVAAVTSIRTTTETTPSRNFKTSYTMTENTAVTTTAPAAVKDTLYMSASFKKAARPTIASAYTAETTEAPTSFWTAATEAATEAPTYNYTYTEPTTGYKTENVYIAPTAAPTQAPTQAPTAAPTQAPTAAPTMAPTEAPTEAYVEWTEPEVPEVPEYPQYVETPEVPAYVEEPAAPEVPTNAYCITDEEYIILCNAVAHEAGCNWIDVYDKAKVVEVIMNRVNSPLYPNSIVGVLTQPYQFSGSSSYVYLGDFTSYVSQSVKDAVDLYFNEPDSFAHGYFGFYGDGYRNYFY